MIRASLAALALTVSAVGYAPAAFGQSGQLYMNAQGADCIRSVRQYTEPTYAGGTRYNWVLRNVCQRAYSVIADLSIVDPSNTTHTQTQRTIQPLAEETLSCSYEPYQVRISCNGFTGEIQAY